MRAVLQDKILPRGFYDAINAINAQANLALCLDIGDSRCSDLSAQQLTDLSGSANHFYRGSTSGAEASDPTFNGNANAKSNLEYISFDGGDFCTPTGSPTFDDTFHKDNAIFTMACIFYNAANGSNRVIFGNSNSTTVQGVSFFVNNDGTLRFLMKNGVAAANYDSTNVIGVGWNFLAISVDEANAFGLHVINNLATRFDSTYSSPSATDPADNPEIGARGGTSVTQILQSGDRIGGFAAWNRCLTAAELRAIYDAMKPRYALP